MDAELISNTLNNMACFHLQMNYPHAALNCLERAYFLTPEDQQVLLNMCAALSSLKRHEAAFEFAKQAYANASDKNKGISVFNMGV